MAASITPNRKHVPAGGAHVTPIPDTLERFVLDGPRSHGALSVVPLLGTDAPERDWLMLDEAGEAVSLQEVGER